MNGSEDDRTPAALESEQALIGALVRGVHCEAVRAVLHPERCFNHDNPIIAKAAYALLDRGTRPDERLIAASVGHLLDSIPYLYRIADASIGVTPDRIAEHARRIDAAWAARRLLAELEGASRRLRAQPASVFNGLPGHLSTVLADIQKETGSQAAREASILCLISSLESRPRQHGTW